MTSTILFILFVLSFCGYNYTVFSYCGYIFSANKFPLVKGIICGLLNISFLAFYIFFLPVQFEALAICTYAVALAIEIRLVLKANFTQMLFIGVTFTVNLFAKRLAVLATIALINDSTITQAVTSSDMLLIVGIVSFTLSISTIRLARKSIPRNSLDTILADNKNLTFLTAAFSILLLTLFFFLLTIHVDAGRELLYHYIVLAVSTIAAFSTFIVFAYFLAELRISTETYKRLSAKNVEALEDLKDLEEEATKDNLTGLFTRDYADNVTQRMVEQEKSFFVAFIDLDGLKTVNDTFGHEEGDFYIRTVAEILSDYFREHVVCRYGGDEMVVLGRYSSEDEITKSLIQCYRAVLNIPKQYSKEYVTSISYGVAFKHPNEIITAKELIAIADARMYELKRSHKRHRKVIAVK